MKTKLQKLHEINEATIESFDKFRRAHYPKGHLEPNKMAVVSSCYTKGFADGVRWLSKKIDEEEKSSKGVE